MALLFVDKVALVTGGGSGIGKASALRFAAEGAQVVVSDIDPGAGAETVDEICGAGGEAVFVGADLTRSADIASLVDKVLSAYGRLDVALNNAGTSGPYKSILDLSEEEWDRTLTLNLKSVFLCMKHEIAAMLERGGAIVNTSSASILKISTQQPDYQASKAGLVALTRSAAVAYGERNIRVNALLPGATATPMLMNALASRGASTEPLAAATPLRRIGAAEELANAAVWLCSDQASFVTGVMTVVDGGKHLV